MLVIAQAFRHGMSVEEVHSLSKFDPWFLREIRRIVEAEADVRADGLPADAKGMLRLKKLGFSAARLAELAGQDEATVAAARPALGGPPVYKPPTTPPPSP